MDWLPVIIELLLLVGEILIKGERSHPVNGNGDGAKKQEGEKAKILGKNSLVPLDEEAIRTHRQRHSERWLIDVQFGTRAIVLKDSDLTRDNLKFR